MIPLHSKSMKYESTYHITSLMEIGTAAGHKYFIIKYKLTQITWYENEHRRHNHRPTPL